MDAACGLNDHDQRLLAVVDAALAGWPAAEDDDEAFYTTCAQLARGVPALPHAFGANLETRLLALWHEANPPAPPANQRATLWPWARLSLLLTGATRGRHRLSPARGLALVLIVVSLLAGLGASAVAIYNQIVVVEPSQETRLSAVLQKADFPLWASGQGELIRVMEIGRPGEGYGVFLDYQLTDGSRLQISQSRDFGDPIITGLERWKQEAPDKLQILDRNVDINGHDGVLFTLQGGIVSPPPAGYTIRDRILWLRWHVDGTQLTMYEDPEHGPISAEQMIAIAKSLRRVTP